MRCLIYPIYNEDGEGRIKCFTQVSVGKADRKHRKTFLGYVNLSESDVTRVDNRTTIIQDTKNLRETPTSFIFIEDLSDIFKTKDVEVDTFAEAYVKEIREGKETKLALLLPFHKETDLCLSRGEELLEVTYLTDDWKEYKYSQYFSEDNNMLVLIFKTVEEKQAPGNPHTAAPAGAANQEKPAPDGNGLCGDCNKCDGDNCPNLLGIDENNPPSNITYRRENMAIWATLFIEGRPITVVFDSTMNETISISNAPHSMPVSVVCRDIDIWRTVYLTAIKTVRDILEQQHAMMMAQYQQSPAGHVGRGDMTKPEINVDVFMVIGSCKAEDIKPFQYNYVNEVYALFDSVVSSQVSNNANLVIKVIDEDNLEELVNNIETLGQLFMRGTGKYDASKIALPRLFSDAYVDNNDGRKAAIMAGVYPRPNTPEDAQLILSAKARGMTVEELLKEK